MSLTYPHGLRPLLEELDAEGTRNDAATSERARRWLSITPDTGAFLSVLVRTQGSRHVLELGSSHGYSTIWLASAAAAHGGHVTTVDVDARKTAHAAHNVKRAGLQSAVTLVTEDGGAFLRESPEAHWELVFLDAERSTYTAWWPDLWRSLRPGGLLVVDNAVSHAAELVAFVAGVDRAPDAMRVLVPVGKGELLVVKTSN